MATADIQTIHPSGAAWGAMAQETTDVPSASLAPQELEKEKIERIRKALTTFELPEGREKLLHDISTITPEALTSLLENLFEEGIHEGRFMDEEGTIHKLAEMIPLEALEKAIGTNPTEALQKAKGLFLQAKYYLEQQETQASPALSARFSNFLDAVISFIESILSAFGIADFFEPSETEFQSQHKFHKVMMLISFFSMLTALLVPVLGAAIAGPIIGGALLLIAAASVIYHYYPPPPSHLPHAKNWTKECQNAGDAPLLFSKGRKEILDEMADALIKGQNGKLKKHPLLIGKSRVGKTQTAKAFAQAILRGDYPELKGKKVFYLNTTKLCKKGDFFNQKDPIEQISEAIGRHRDDYILVFDEIHVAFQGEKNGMIGQKLKEMLDQNGDFPNVIGITTKEEFNAHISKDEAFVNRFQPIAVESTTAEVTQEILSHAVIASPEHPFCEKGALKSISEKTMNSSWTEPYSSLMLLQDCIQKTSSKQKSPLAKKIQEHKDHKEFLISQGTIAPIDFDEVDDVSQQIEELDKKLKDLEAALIQENEEFQRLMDGKKTRTAVRLQLYRTVMKIAEIKDGLPSSVQDKQEMGAFLLQSRFLSPAVDNFVRTQAKKLGVKAVIDEEVIEESFQQMVKKQELKQKSAAVKPPLF